MFAAARRVRPSPAPVDCRWWAARWSGPDPRPDRGPANPGEGYKRGGGRDGFPNGDKRAFVDPSLDMPANAWLRIEPRIHRGQTLLLEQIRYPRKNDQPLDSLTHGGTCL